MIQDILSFAGGLAGMGESGWQSRLSTASFQGVEFLTERHEAKNGRRLVVHEYPGADIPMVEDLGAKAGGWQVRAYFVGPDYDTKRNALLAVLAKGGAEWLTHPWLGKLWVRAKDWSTEESLDQGGYAAVQIEFVEGGESLQPTLDATDAAFGGIDDFIGAALGDFKLQGMSALGFTSFVQVIAGKLTGWGKLLGLARLPVAWLARAKGMIGGLQDHLDGLLQAPAGYAAALYQVTNTLGGSQSVATVPGLTDGQAGVLDAILLVSRPYAGSDADASAEAFPRDTDLPRIVAAVAAMAMPSVIATPLPETAANDMVLRTNIQIEQDLRARLLVATAAQLAMADYRAEPDRDAVAMVIANSFDALLPAINSDQVFEAAVTARQRVLTVLQAQDLRPLETRAVALPLPAVVLAHRLQVDLDVFMARNAAAARHPLFVRGVIHG